MDQVKALQERLRLAKDEQQLIAKTAKNLRETIAHQDSLIANLLTSVGKIEKSSLEGLARANSEAKTAITNLASSADSLGTTLTLSPGHFKVTGGDIEFKLTRNKPE